MSRLLAMEWLVAAGFLALSLVGGPLPWVAAGAWALCLLLRWLPWRWRQRVPWAVATALWLCGTIVWVAAGLAAVETLGLLLAFLQLHRRGARRTAHDDRVSVVLAGLMLVAAAGGTQGVVFLAPALAFAVCLPLTLLPEGKAGSGWGWVPLHLALAWMLFVVLPRPMEPEPAEAPARLTGFAPDVELGALDPLLDDPSVVFRAKVPEKLVSRRLYWRGLALDGFDGRRWFSSTKPTPSTLHGGSHGDVVQVDLVSALDGVLFVPGRVVDLDLDGVRADSQGGWFRAPADGPLSYQAVVVPGQEGERWFRESDVDHRRWLGAPTMNPAVGRLAQSIAGQGSDEEKVDRLAAWLQAEVEYTRDARAPSDAPLEHFLLEDRRGHCEFVAAGLAVMGRAVGIPTRVVNGFAGGEYNPLTGELVVRRQHAHSWTEVLLDDHWVLLDATPPPEPVPAPPWWGRGADAADAVDAWWTADVVPFDRSVQKEAVVQTALAVEAAFRLANAGSLPWRGLTILAVMAVLLALGLRWLVRWVVALWTRSARERPSGPVARQHTRARIGLSAAGFEVPLSLPPLAAARALRGRAPDAVVESLEALAWLYYETTLGDGDPADSAREAQRLADVVVNGLRVPGP